VYADCQRRAADFFNEAAAWHASDFWAARADRAAAGVSSDSDHRDHRDHRHHHDHPDRTDHQDRPDPTDEAARVRLAFDLLRNAERIRLRPASTLQFASIADIEGREVVLREGVVMPGDDRPVRFSAGVNLPALVRLAAECDEVPALFSAYNTHIGPVPMDGLLTGLSLLVARQALVSEDARS
jgi:hypothetical protein